MPNCKLYGGRKQATTNFFFSLEQWAPQEINAPINVKPAGVGGRAWGGDLIVFVRPGVGHLTDLVLLGEGIFGSFFARCGDIWLPTRTKKTETERMFPASTLHACAVRFEKIKRPGTCIFSDAAMFIKDCRVLMYLEIFLEFCLGIDSNVQPGVGKFGFIRLEWFARGQGIWWQIFEKSQIPTPCPAWALQLGIMIDMSTPPPFAAFSSQWMKHRALLRNELLRDQS